MLCTCAELSTLLTRVASVAAELEGALERCVAGYESGGGLAPRTLACLPPYPVQCGRVANAGGMPHCQVYTAAAGDTIAGLAAAFGVSHQELFAANPLYGDAELAGGDPVYIPPWSPMECRTWAGPTPK
jgi:hypothetical protein